MQIVIDISETAYNYFAQGLRFTDDVEMAIIAIVDGTPLPKGHGDLIDRNELKSTSYEVLVEDGGQILDGYSAYNGLTEDDIDSAPTIIEADKEQEK